MEIYLYWIIIALESLTAGLLIWDRFKTKSEIKRLNNLLDKTGQYAERVDPKKLSYSYEKRIELKDEEYETLKGKYEELLIMPIRLMGAEDVDQETLDRVLDSYPLNAPVVRERLRKVRET